MGKRYKANSCCKLEVIAPSMLNFYSLLFTGHSFCAFHPQIMVRIFVLRVGGHPWDTKKVSVTGAGDLRECKNTEFVWEFGEIAFCEGGRKKSFLLMRVLVRRASTVCCCFSV